MTFRPATRVLHVVRRRSDFGSHSVEGLFETIRAHLPPDIQVETAMPPRLSQGIRNRVANVAWMRTHRSRVTHITGDITYLAAALPRHGSIVTILDTGWVARSWAAQRLFHYMWIRMPVARAERVTVISQHVRQAVVAITGCDTERITVIPCCVHPSFIPEPAHGGSTRPTVLQIGSSANKNIERVAAALDNLDCELHLIGQPSPSQTAALQRHRIRFRVSVNLSRADVVRAYQEAALVIFASTFEGFGLPILEAQAVGCPVVTSNIPPMTEVASDGACLVDPFDISSIREGIQRALHDSAYRSALKRRGFENVEKYRAGPVAQQYAALYREVAGT
jgi:glycosyltransferase involved in cell wall biosynthesis